MVDVTELVTESALQASVLGLYSFPLAPVLFRTSQESRSTTLMKKMDGRMDSNQIHRYVTSEGEQGEDDFLISNKSTACKKWRTTTLALNVLWRFRQTGTVKIEVELKNEELVTKFKTITHVLLALYD